VRSNARRRRRGASPSVRPSDREDYLDDALHSALVELREQGSSWPSAPALNFLQPLLRFVTETDVDVVMVAGR